MGPKQASPTKHQKRCPESPAADWGMPSSLAQGLMLPPHLMAKLLHPLFHLKKPYPKIPNKIRKWGC